MIDRISEAQAFDRGEVATIFALGSDRVLKLYRAEGPAGWIEGLPRLHAEEARAYSIASDDLVLAAHVPTYFGVEEVGCVVDSTGVNVSARYDLRLGLVLERLSGAALKPAEMDGVPAHVEALLNQMDGRGIFTGDCSVFNHESAEQCKFIDLTTSLGNRLNCELISQNRASPEELDAWFRGE